MMSRILKTRERSGSSNTGYTPYPSRFRCMLARRGECWSKSPLCKVRVMARGDLGVCYADSLTGMNYYFLCLTCKFTIDSMFAVRG